MKLSEALIKRADLQKRYNELKNRIMSNTQVQEGDSPSEDPDLLVAEIKEVLADLCTIIRKINKTNSQVFLGNGISITDAIAMRDMLKSEHELYTSIASNATVTPRYSRSEIKTVSVIDVNHYRELADKIAMEYRTLDTNIQTINWNTELIET